MEITLEKIELVKDRTGVTYAEAKAALEEADGSVVDAIIAIEETINAGQKKRGFGKKGEALFESIKALVSKGNVSKIQVKREGEIVLNVPVNAGIVGVVIAPLASVVAVVAAFGFKCTIEVIKDDGTIIDVSDAVTDAMGRMKKDTEEFDFSECFEENDSDVEIKAEDEDVDSIDVEKSASDTAEDPTADTKTEGESAEESLKQEEEK